MLPIDVICEIVDAAMRPIVRGISVIHVTLACFSIYKLIACLATSEIMRHAKIMPHFMCYGLQRVLRVYSIKSIRVLEY